MQSIRRDIARKTIIDDSAMTSGFHGSNYQAYIALGSLDEASKLAFNHFIDDRYDTVKLGVRLLYLFTYVDKGLYYASFVCIPILTIILAIIAEQIAVIAIIPFAYAAFWFCRRLYHYTILLLTGFYPLELTIAFESGENGELLTKASR
jgi:hypothetical protein